MNALALAAAPVIALTVLVAGCAIADKPAPATNSSSPAATASSSTSPAAGAISCRLPVAGANSGNGIPVGFIQLPSGAFQADSTPGIVYDSTAQVAKTTQTPVLHGDSGATYDRAASRWLPVAPAQVLADGSAYVYTREASPSQQLNEIHLVNVATAGDRIIYNQGAYDALAYRPEGVYLVHHLNGTDGANGLWLLNPATGSLKAFPASQQASWAAVTEGAAWSNSVGLSRFESNSFARLDLASGTIQTWFSVESTPAAQGGPPSRTVRLIGFDSTAHPLVQVAEVGKTPQVWLLSAPGKAARVAGVFPSDFAPAGVNDDHGAWLVGVDGIYLYRGSSIERVVSAAQGWSQGYGAAGACA